MDFIKCKKLKDGRWEVYDSDGNSAFGITKKLAENQYRILYQTNTEPMKINMSKYVGGIYE